MVVRSLRIETNAIQPHAYNSHTYSRDPNRWTLRNVCANLTSQNIQFTMGIEEGGKGGIEEALIFLRLTSHCSDLDQFNGFLTVGLVFPRQERVQQHDTDTGRTG